MAIRQTTNCFPETFQGLLSRYLGILPNFFQGMFRDFCPIIWAFCVFFSRTHFRDFCSVIWAFCGFFSQGTFQGLLSRYLGILPFFFQETFQGLLSRYLGILRFFFQETFQGLLSRYLGILQIFFQQIGKNRRATEQLLKVTKDRELISVFYCPKSALLLLPFRPNPFQELVLVSKKCSRDLCFIF